LLYYIGKINYITIRKNYVKRIEPFKKYLSIREIEVAFDAVCGKPVMWG